MGKQIRNLGMFLTACYVALFFQLNRLTVFEAEELKDKPGNNREAERNFDRPRGSISTADGTVIAETVPATDGRRFELQRQYPTGDLFGQITGYYTLVHGSDGLEREYDDELAGDDRPIRIENLDDLFDDYFVDKEHVGNMTVTLRNDVQEEARAALEGRQGSVVVMNPQTGAILGMYSNPAYDPNPLASHDFEAAAAAKEAMNAMPNAVNPLIAHSYQDIFFPGSTFKVVTGSAGVDSGQVTPENPNYDVMETFQATGSSAPIPNFGGSSCGGTLFLILQKSCNTAFAQMGADIGADPMIATAEAYGFNRELPLDLPDPAVSNFPLVDAEDRAFRALMAIGQKDTKASPLQMALVAAAVANDGEVMKPHVMQEIRDEEEQVIKTGPDDEVWSRAISSSTADTMRDAMISVVTDGTAFRMAEGLEQYEIGGKTGTAQLGTEEPRSHAWIIGFAGPPGEDPTVAVAVILEGAEGVTDEQTGGRQAAPIANRVLRVALEGQSAGN